LQEDLAAMEVCLNTKNVKHTRFLRRKQSYHKTCDM